MPNLVAPDILEECDAARKEADQATAVLLERLSAIKTEKKDVLARLNGEAKLIRAKLGRTRGPRKAKPGK